MLAADLLVKTELLSHGITGGEEPGLKLEEVARKQNGGWHLLRKQNGGWHLLTHLVGAFSKPRIAPISRILGRPEGGCSQRKMVAGT
jgi:hypothetical protein